MMMMMMAAHRLTRSLRRATPTTITTILDLHSYVLHEDEKLNFLTRRKSYIAEMQKSAFDGNILRLLRNEIRYEFQRSPPTQPVLEFDSFTVDERPGEQWIRLSKKFGENEEIKVEVTMFDGSLPVKKTGGVATDDNVELHITMVVDIFKDNGNSVLEFVCSAWPNSMEIQKVFVRGHDGMASQPYLGPGFKDLDDELQNSLYEYLEKRGVNDELAVFLHRYIKNKDKSEFIRWMGNVKSFIDM